MNRITIADLFIKKGIAPVVYQFMDYEALKSVFLQLGIYLVDNNNVLIREDLNEYKDWVFRLTGKVTLQIDKGLNLNFYVRRMKYEDDFFEEAMLGLYFSKTLIHGTQEGVMASVYSWENTEDEANYYFEYEPTQKIMGSPAIMKFENIIGMSFRDYLNIMIMNLDS